MRASFDQIGPLCRRLKKTLLISKIAGPATKLTDSTLQAGDSFVVGNDGVGTLTIANDGVVSVGGGGGTLTLANNAGSTGSLNIGVAVGETAAAAGTLNAETVAIGAGDGTINFNHTDTDYTFAAGVTGTGSALINQTSGVTRLTGDGSSFTGHIKVTGGTLIVDNTDFDSNTTSVNGGALAIENGGTITTGAAGGSGTIGAGSSDIGMATVTGTGSSWTNRTALRIGLQGTGTLDITDGGAVSDVEGWVGYDPGSNGAVNVTGEVSSWTNSASVHVGRRGTGAINVQNGATVSSGGAVFLASSPGGAGTITVSGSGSTLDAATNVFVGNNGTGTMTISDDGAAIAGAGTINHRAGVTSLSADSSGFTGTTNITGGTLRVNNALGGAVNVAGGTIGGSGTLGNLAVAAGGTLAPGNSIGTLNVASITINAGSTYEVEVNSAVQSDLINATGTATINGGAVTVLPFPDFALDTAYTIVTAAGSLTGAYDSASYGADSLFITSTLSYDANNAFVTLAQTAGFASAAMTPNQMAAAGGADSLGNGNAIWNAIANLNDADAANAAFDAISGEVHASAKTALVEDSRFVRDAATDRVRAAFAAVAASAVPVLAYGEDGRELVSADTQRFAVWGQGFGSWSRWNGDGNAAGMSRDIGGLFIGGDAEIADNVRLGLMGGYARSSLGVADRMSSATADSYTLGVYAGGQWDGTVKLSADWGSDG